MAGPISTLLEWLLIGLPALVLLDLRPWLARSRGAVLAEARVTLEIWSATIALGWVFRPFLWRIYEYCERSAGLSLPFGAVGHALLSLVAIDFIYYWIHRLQHRVPWLWMTHRTHHQSRYFNLSVALRQPILWSAFLVHLPLALILFGGVKGAPLATAFLAWGLYGHCTHLSAFPRLGFLEKHFVTPNNHRIHHFRDLPDGSGNFSGLFRVWDRWFGTWVECQPQAPLGLRDDRNPASLFASVTPAISEKLAQRAQTVFWDVPASGPIAILREVALVATWITACLALSAQIHGTMPKISDVAISAWAALVSVVVLSLTTKSYRADEPSFRRPT